MTANVPVQRGIIDRMVAAARLDRTVYEEVETDRTATGQAAFIVVATSIAAGAIDAAGGIDDSLLAGLGALIGWGVQAWLINAIGTRFLRAAETASDIGQVARTTGFAQTPRFLLFLAVIPGVGALVAFVVGIWVIVTTVLAIRAALDVGLGRAIATAVATALVQAVILALFVGLA